MCFCQRKYTLAGIIIIRSQDKEEEAEEKSGMLMTECHVSVHNRRVCNNKLQSNYHQIRLPATIRTMLFSGNFFTVCHNFPCLNQRRHNNKKCLVVNAINERFLGWNRVSSAYAKFLPRIPFWRTLKFELSIIFSIWVRICTYLVPLLYYYPKMLFVALLWLNRMLCSNRTWCWSHNWMNAPNCRFEVNEFFCLFIVWVKQMNHLLWILMRNSNRENNARRFIEFHNFPRFIVGEIVIFCYVSFIRERKSSPENISIHFLWVCCVLANWNQ